MSNNTFNPYVGLRPFRADENLLFFGRDNQTLELLQRLHQHRFVPVVGGSGSGKSSLIRAGLIPALKGGYLVEDSNKWLIAVMKPGQSPMYNLAEVILRQVKPNANSEAISAFIKSIKREGVAAIMNQIIPLKKEKNTNFFLLVDQFEELFRFSMDQGDSTKKTEAIDFVNLILNLSKQSTSPVYVVLTMRSDFIGDCSQFHDLPEAMNKSQYLVPKLDRRQLKMVIEGPAKLYGGKFHQALTSRLLNDLGNVKDELPLVQHALMRMWNYKMNMNSAEALNLQDYKNIGGIDEALSHHADEALNGMSKADLLIAKTMFQALTAIDENGRKIRRPLLLSDLKVLTEANEEKLHEIINHFIENSRSFLIVDKAGDTDDKVIDISHESLIRQWDTLNHWVDEENEAASYYLQLAEATKLNALNKKDFLTGSELQLALEWQKKYNPTAVWANRYKEGFAQSIDYLNRSEQERVRLENVERLRKKKQKRLVRVVIGLMALVVVTMSYAAFFVHSKNKVLAIKDKAFNLHFKAKDLIPIDPTLAIRLEQEAIKLHDFPEFEKSALSMINYESFYEIMVEDSSSVRAIGVSPIDEILAIGWSDGYVSLINTEGRILKKFKAHGENIHSVAFAPNGKSILTGSTEDHTAYLWDLEGNVIAEYDGHEGAITSVAFAPEGTTILTGSIDGTAHLWDLEGNVLAHYRGHGGVVTSVTFDPDGDRILTGSSDYTARLWDLDGELVTEFLGHHNIVTSVAFAPDCDFILTGSMDYTARLWDLKGTMVTQFLGHIDPITSVAFAPDDKSVLTGSEDLTARVWSLEGDMITHLKGHKAGLTSVAYSSNGNSIYTGSDDGTARIWDLEEFYQSLRETMVHSRVASLAYNPNGKHILTGSYDAIARMWDLQGNQEAEFRGHQNIVTAVTFSPDGLYVLTGSADRSVRLWNIDGTMITEITEHADAITSVAFSPDNKFVLTGSNGIIRLLDIEGNLIQEFPTFGTSLTSLSFSPDGQSILATGTGSPISVRMYDLQARIINKFARFGGYPVTSADFSPDGNYILTGHKDKIARLWDLRGALITEFKGHHSAINSVVYGPDGTQVITGSRGGTVRLWSLKGIMVERLRSPREGVTAVAISPDSRTVLMGSGNVAALFTKVSLQDFLINGNIEPLTDEQREEYEIDK